MAVSKKCKGFLCLLYVGLLFTSGILLLGSTIYFGYKLVSFTSYFKFAPVECIGPFILLFLLAAAQIGVSWLGVNGTIKNNLKFIFWLLVVLVLEIISELSVGIWAMVLRGKIADHSSRLINVTFHDFVKNGYYKSDWEMIQGELQCCGVNNTGDYRMLQGSVPISCFMSENITFQQGCREPIIDYVKKLIYNIGLISFGSMLFLVLGVLCFYNFHKTIKEEKREPVVQNRPHEENPLNKRLSKK